MQYYYGVQNILRALDEAEFWKHQEAEHAGLIPVVAQGLEPQYVHRLEQFGIELHTMNAEAAKYIQSINRSMEMTSHGLNAQMLNFIHQCVEQSKSFSAFMTEMLQNSHVIRASQSAQALLHHMIRESQYFIGIDQLMLSQ
jgi:hypothetical protein